MIPSTQGMNPHFHDNSYSKKRDFLYKENAGRIRKPIVGTSFMAKKIANLKSINQLIVPRNPKDSYENITISVFEPQRIRMLNDGDPVSFECAIQIFIKDLKLSKASTQSKNSQLQIFVKAILDNNHPVETIQRARFALLSLEKVEAGLSTLNYQISQLMDSKDQGAQSKARARLTSWLNSPKSPLQLNFPMKPHRISRQTPDYSSLVCPRKTDADGTKHPFWQFPKILMGNTQEKKSCYFANIQEIAAQEGIPEPLQSGPEWLRDPIIILENDRYLLPSHIDFGLNASNLLGFTKSHFQTLIDLLLGSQESIMGEASQEADPFRMFSNFREAPFYFEGGNLIPTINSAGEKTYLCGASNILFSILNSNSLFSSKEKKDSLVKEMQSLEETFQFSEKQLLFIQERLEQAKLLDNFNEEDKIKIAKLTVAKISFLEKEINSTLGCKTIVLGNIFEAQPEFHLDMFLMPAPGGVIYIQDYSLSCDIIKKIQEQYRNVLNLDDMQRLESYLNEAEKRQRKYGTQLEEISNKLKLNGFNVLPLAGAYYTEGRCTINFLNSIVGIGKEEMFCITSGSSHPVDRYLRDAFTFFLNTYGIKHVYFTGRETFTELGNGSLPTMEFQEADQSLLNAGGIHCRTQTASASFKDFKHEESLLSTSKGPHSTAGDKFVGDTLPQFYNELLKRI